MEIAWEDLRAVYARMQALQLLLTGYGPCETAGTIMTIATYAHAAKRGGDGYKLSVLLERYGEYTGADPGVVRRKIELYWLRCGHTFMAAEDIIMEVISG